VDRELRASVPPGLPEDKFSAHQNEFLVGRGHGVFIDTTLRTGEAWLYEIDRQIKASDFLICLLSKKSADSAIVRSEVKREYEFVACTDIRRRSPCA